MWMVITSEYTDFTAFLFRSNLLSLQLMEMTSLERMVVYLLFAVIAAVPLNNILLYKTIQPTCVFVPVLKIHKTVPTYISGATHIPLIVCTSWSCTSDYCFPTAILECQQIQPTAFFSFRLSDLVGIFFPSLLGFLSSDSPPPLL